MPEAPREGAPADSAAVRGATQARGETGRQTDHAPLRRLLFYAMYDTAGLDAAPKVRIEMIGAALERQVSVTWIRGTRRTRLRPALAWLVRGGWRSIDGVYVEASSSTAAPWDLLVLLVARLAGKPVGVYFRDAYWLFRDLYPAPGMKARLLDASMRLSHPLVRAVATKRFVPSNGLAAALGIRDAILLPPGTDPSMPDLGIDGTVGEPLVAAVLSPSSADGLDLLWAAMVHVHGTRPDARLRVVCGALPPGPWKTEPWVEHRRAARTELAAVLAPARLLVMPRPRSVYADLALPLRTFDLIGFGKPMVAVAATEVAAWLGPAGAALLVDDEPTALAAGILRVLDDDRLATTLGRAARRLAERPDATWDARARTVLSTLGGGRRGPDHRSEVRATDRE